ncbi:NUDIX domain-containing protein [Streptomyces acidicola]|uniref:NUDIX domain-containing protein n=1 Tax=Streptomyces acidicola TaxID=2596892 RepID=A0A5N8WJQ9_9ACTN|nr:NUDIX domain-containing protein [Streptomyces acidicola]MPY47352.1 NUDIX domain-containing protein [Streptomyces acidicola]
MPPARTDIRDLVHTYLERHPAERRLLQGLLASLDAAEDPASRSALPWHITSTAVVIDRDRRVLHIHHKAGGLVLTPGGHVETGDRTPLTAALRVVAEEAGIEPGDLCLTPQFLRSPIDIDVHDIDADHATGEPTHQHYDLRFVFYLAHGHPELALQDQEAGGVRAEWRAFDQVVSPTLRAKLLDSSLNGRPKPVNASALIHDGAGRYLLHLRDNYPGIWEPGAFALLGGGREPGDTSLEATLRRELAEEVPGLDVPDLTPFVVEQATGIDGLCTPIQIWAGQWNGDPDRLALTEGVLLRWFSPAMLHRLRLSLATRDLVQRHAAQQASTNGGPPGALASRAPAAGRSVLNVIGVHLYLEDDGRVLLGLRHPDSAYAGGSWHFLAGHCEQESAIGCLVREAFEEAGLVIAPADVELVHTVHVVDSPGERPRMQMVFRARRWKGAPSLREPDKCLAWRWWPQDDLPEPIVPYTRAALDGIRTGRLYTEMGW